MTGPAGWETVARLNKLRPVDSHRVCRALLTMADTLDLLSAGAPLDLDYVLERFRTDRDALYGLYVAALMCSQTGAAHADVLRATVRRWASSGSRRVHPAPYTTRTGDRSSPPLPDL